MNERKGLLISTENIKLFTEEERELIKKENLK